MPPDLAKYRKYVDGFNLSDSEKDELLLAVWGILEGIVDRAFGIHPVQIACGSRRSERSIDLGNDIDLGTQFSERSIPETRPDGRRKA